MKYADDYKYLNNKGSKDNFYTGKNKSFRKLLLKKIKVYDLFLYHCISNVTRSCIDDIHWSFSNYGNNKEGIEEFCEYLKCKEYIDLKKYRNLKLKHLINKVCK